MLSVRLREWATLEPANTPVLRGLRLDGERERTEATRLADKKFLTIEELATGLRIQSASFVGRVQLGSLVVTIEPKLARQPLLALVRYGYGLHDLERFAPTALATGGTLLQDLLAMQLLAEVSDIVSRGLPRRYVAREERLATPRGRIDFPALAPRSVPSMDLPCRHSLRSADHTLLRVLRGGLDLAARIAVDATLRFELHALSQRLGAEVESVRVTQELLSQTRRSLNRLESSTEPALNLIELLLSGQEASLEADDVTRLPGFLFDMNRLFQAIIGRFLRENLPRCEVQEEKALKHLLHYAENPRGKQAPRPRPDFAVTHPTQGRTLLDAKYRDLWERDLPREMLYQLALYATSGATKHTAVMLYPTESRAARDARIDIHDVGNGAVRGGVALRPVNLPELAEVVRGERDDEARRRIAERWAFG